MDGEGLIAGVDVTLDSLAVLVAFRDRIHGVC